MKPPPHCSPPVFIQFKQKPSAIGLKKKKYCLEIQTESLGYVSFWETINESFP